MIHVIRASKKTGIVSRVGIDRIKVWQCVGCGRIDDPQPCVGICRDEKREYVAASEHDRVVGLLEAVVRAIATTAPREGEAARHWAALRERARRALRAIEPHPETAAPAGGGPIIAPWPPPRPPGPPTASSS